MLYPGQITALKIRIVFSTEKYLREKIFKVRFIFPTPIADIEQNQILQTENYLS